MPELVTIGESMVSFVPESNGPLRYVNSFAKRFAGAESNVAIGMVRLGHSSGWISKLGDDEFGNYLKQQIRGEGVDVSQTSVAENAPTGLMFKEFGMNDQTRVTYYRKNSAASEIKPSDINENYIANARILHITGITPALSATALDTINYAIDLAHKHDTIVSFDPNIRLKLWTENEAVQTLSQLIIKSDIVLLGYDEAKVLLKLEDMDSIIDKLLEMNVSHIGLKCGSEGAWVATKTTRYKIDSYPVKVIDSIGAGDAFNAGFLSGVLEKKSIEECGKMGCAMGAFAITNIGDIEAIPTRSQLDNFMNCSNEIFR